MTVVPLNPAMALTNAPPVMEARRWLTDTPPPADLPLVNVSQAAPVDMPPLGLREELARAVIDVPQAHLYGPVLGNPELRAELAARTARIYAGHIAAQQIAITSGCNQAFAAVMATLAGSGDQVMLPVPWYFNHKMWLDMQGVGVVPLPTGSGLLPDPDQAAALITPRTKAIVLVTPNNPGGVEYPAELLGSFMELARSRGIALIVDETYRDFHARDGAPHDLFSDPDWDETLIHLYSFSKAYRLTGHRVGAIATSAGRLAEIEKFLDTVTICPSQIGQIGALWGLRHLSDWLAGERLEILARRREIEQQMTRLPDWRLLGCGAYFAYLQHPFALSSDKLAQKLVADAGVLMLPGTMFTPKDDPTGAKQLRVAFANIDSQGIGTLFDRLSALRYDMP